MLLGLVHFNVMAQDKGQSIEGVVSFVTSQNVYVKFDSTEPIKIGDSLQIQDKKPCLVVTRKSSSSVVCDKINDCIIEKGMTVSYHFKTNKEPVIEDEEIVEDIGINLNDSIQAIEQPKSDFYNEKIRGRLSASSYSTFSETRDDRHRLMSRFSLNAEHFNFSKFSLETYINYRKNISPSETTSSVRDDYLRVFNMALKYDIDTTFSVTVGRKINYKLSSLGAIDGLQAEKKLGEYYVGVIGGFRPDFVDFGFNPDLLQYGAYVGRYTDRKQFRSQTTLGVAEQRNTGALDRRFAYLQHSSTINKKLHLFSMAELDLYNSPSDSINTSSPRLTNLYVSARYRFSRSVNAMLSYDSRKRIIYYKTYETDLEQLLDEDIARQGIRARINIRPLKKIFTGLSYSRRFQSDNQNKSENYYGYVSYSKLPIIEGRASLTYNRNSSNYLDSNIASFRYSRGFFDDRLNADFYYRFVNYNYASDIGTFNQHYVGTYLSYYLDRSLVISLAGEYSTYELENNYRLNFRIIKRFNLKRQK